MSLFVSGGQTLSDVGVMEVKELRAQIIEEWRKLPFPFAELVERDIDSATDLDPWLVGKDFEMIYRELLRDHRVSEGFTMAYLSDAEEIYASGAIFLYVLDVLEWEDSEAINDSVLYVQFLGIASKHWAKQIVKQLTPRQAGLIRQVVELVIESAERLEMEEHLLRFQRFRDTLHRREEEASKG